MERALAASLLMIATGACSPLGAQEPTHATQFRESFSTSGELRAGRVVDTRTGVGGELATYSISGGEESLCHAGSDRASKATISANAELIDRTEHALAFKLNASARASGGHWRTCSACVLGTCIGIHGNDSESFATARSSGIVRITLPASPPDERFTVRVLPSGEAADELQYVLSDPNVGALLTQGSTAREATVAGGPARELQLAADLRASAVDAGGCCSAAAEKAAQIQIVVESASNALVSDPEVVVANAQENPVPRIAGGHVETGYEHVGALLFDGPSGGLCTATVVARRTVVTAAHCVRGRATDRLTFVAGPTIHVKDDRIFKVTEVVDPDGTEPGFNFDSLIFADDIALVYVNRDLAVPSASDANTLVPLPQVALHTGTPKLTELHEDGHRLLFIGFGYDDLKGGTGRGIKRRVEMQIAELGSTTFKNRSPGQNTCEGDSGGPVLLVQSNDTIQLVGVVSAGDAHCKNYGINTRVDAFATWLQSRLKN
jgi:secreted trypsin-like serine protease